MRWLRILGGALLAMFLALGAFAQTKEFNGGFTVLDTPTREAAVEWAAKIAAACRCPQEVREFGPDSAVGN
jgi:hypothetical protein